MNSNRNYKDSVFTKLFKDNEKLIGLYNATSGKNYPLNTKVDINTLEEALFLERLNDISFMIDGKLVILIEHQSTVNQNMPLRFLLYIGRIYEKIIDSENIYRKRLIKIPTPEFIVLYNGTEDFPDEKILKLSDAFKEMSPHLELELVVRVYNISKGHNEAIVHKSKDLNDYVTFIARIRENKSKNMTLDEAMQEAIDFCLQNNILYDFLKANSSEVVNMLFTEFNLDVAQKVWKEEGIEQGIEEGILTAALGMLEKNLDDELIKDILKISQQRLLEIKEQFNQPR